MDLSKIYPQRSDFVHKGAYGSVMVIAGSKLYSGSATLAGVSALRAGCDLVTVIGPERAVDLAASRFPDLITYPLKGDFLSTKHLRDIFDLAYVRKINSLVIGPGLGRHRLTMQAIQKIIAKFAIPMVLDADALLAISQNVSIVNNKHVVLTPHAGELAMILGIEKVSDDFDSRLSLAKQAATKYHGVVLLKGHVDIITDGISTISNNSGSSYMTKGGFGDTLAGIVGALLARGVGLMEAAHVGAYINGKAGEMAASHAGDGVLASDIFGYIPRVIHSGEE